jgi:hypothetical protein
MAEYPYMKPRHALRTNVDGLKIFDTVEENQNKAGLDHHYMFDTLDFKTGKPIKNAPPRFTRRPYHSMA